MRHRGSDTNCQTFGWLSWGRMLRRSSTPPAPTVRANSNPSWPSCRVSICARVATGNSLSTSRRSSRPRSDRGCEFHHNAGAQVETRCKRGKGRTLTGNRKESLMLTLTDNATSLIKNLAEQTAVAENAGLRISTTEGDAGLAVDLTPAPEPTDQVVESSGARVFLEQNAAIVLEDKVLDAQLDEGGAVTFAIGQQS